ncbi:MAG: hypothetical protein M0R03_13120 [Novosphingobium sp.]|nr:hypothetical protein [Novosphingobium sp.]
MEAKTYEVVICQCDNCYEYVEQCDKCGTDFKDDQFISCKDGEHICGKCYEK